MKKSIFILLLLFIPLVFGANFTLDNLQSGSRTGSAISSQCRDEFDSFMYLQPEELVNKYCDVVQFRIFWLVVMVGVMWIFEPAFKKIIKKNVKDNPGLWIYLYKYLGVGLLIVIGYALVLLR